MRKLVLVHGAWHGSWCWKKLLSLFDKDSLKIFTPDLTGLGKKRDLLSAAIDLSTHIGDVVEIFEKNSLEETILVGHSYSGMVIRGVAEQVPERIRRLVFLDALFPDDGQAAIDLIPAFQTMVTEITIDEEWIQVIPSPPPRAFGVTNGEEAARIKELLSPMPYRPLTEKISFKNPESRHIPVSYILCEIPLSPASGSAHRKVFSRLKTDGNDCRTINAPHDMMITHPRKLIEILEDIMTLP